MIMIPKMKNHMKVEFLLEIENYSAKKSIFACFSSNHLFFFLWSKFYFFTCRRDSEASSTITWKLLENFTYGLQGKSPKNWVTTLSFSNLSIAWSTRCNFRFALCNDRPSFLVLFQLHTVLNLNNCPKTRYWKNPKLPKYQNLYFLKKILNYSWI